MKKNKVNFFERLFYNNKFLIVFSLVTAFVLWAYVKINYSETTTRTVTDVKIDLQNLINESNGYVPFNADDLRVDIVVSGSAYNINARALTSNDITVEPSQGMISEPGITELTLVASVDAPGVAVDKITPSSVKVYFDKLNKDDFNVIPNVNPNPEAADGYILSPIVVNPTTVEVSGPESILKKVKNVYFNGTIDEEKLQKQVQITDIDISYGLDDEKEQVYLTCTPNSPPSITIPVNQVATVETSVNFLNKPPYFEKNEPKVTIDPAKVEIAFSPKDAENNKTFDLGKIDFRELKNTVNTRKFTSKDFNASLLTEPIDSFKVQVDFSSMSSETLDLTKSNVVFTNQSETLKYEPQLENAGLNKVKIIGPAASLKKLRAEDLQIEINVSDLTEPAATPYSVEIGNISIVSEDVDDCWVYGTYRAHVLVTENE